VNSLITRRRLLALLPPSLVAAILAACGGKDDAPSSNNQPSNTTQAPQASSSSSNTSAGTGNTQQLKATPACGDADDVTPEQTEGPYFTRNSPERTSLIESGATGTKLVLEGRVLNRACQPIARALVDFWQADDKGEYDNRGYRYRGHQFTDAEGRYKLETMVPGLYPGRTRHIHVKAQAPSKPVLTTQLYFPNEAGNARDGIFNQDLVMDLKDASGGKAGTFDFVLDV
jgi:protocatechuate 3,4-dioxygenase beta subunit